MKYENRLSDNDTLQEKIREHRPLDAYEVKQLKEYYRIGLTYSSNALEGNSLTESETKVVLEDIPPIIRGDYISALRDSNKGDNTPFINFTSCCVWESQKEYLRLLESLDRK